MVNTVQNRDRLSSLWIWAAGFAAVALLQIHYIIPIGEAGLKLTAADPFFPFALCGCLFLCWRKNKGIIPRWRIDGSYMLAAFACLTLMYGIGVVTALVKPIPLNSWVVFNRLVGWGVMLGYCATGMWMVCLWGQKLYKGLVLGCILFPVVSAVPDILYLVFPALGTNIFEHGIFFRLIGLSLNANAYAFSIMVGLAFVLGEKASANSRSWKKTGPLFGALAAVLVGSFSLSGWLAGFLQVCVALWRKWFSIKLLFVFSVICTSVFTGLIIADSATNRPQSYISNVYMYFSRTIPHQPSQELAPSISERQDVFQFGFEQWRENPVFGLGLGGHIEKRKELGLPVVLQHSTPLWVLEEFGLVGFGLFLMAFGLLLWGLRQNWPAVGACGPPIMLLLTGWAAMSIMHEMFHQRLVWFVLGALLAKPLVEAKGPSTDSTG